MADDSATKTETNTETETGWMSDVQRALALLLIGSVTFMIFVLTLRIMWSGDLATVGALLKELKDALVNMSLIALGFFFGNTMAKMAQDRRSADVVEKLTGQNPPGGPVAPLPAPAVVVAWWSLLNDAEKAAIEAYTPNPRVMKFIETSKIGKATPDDLTYLVSLGLLTAERAATLKDA